jgi:hypothetical protein
LDAMQVPTYAKYIWDILNLCQLRRSSSWPKNVVRQSWTHRSSRKRI